MRVGVIAWPNNAIACPGSLLRHRHFVIRRLRKQCMVCVLFWSDAVTYVMLMAHLHVPHNNFKAYLRMLPFYIFRWVNYFRDGWIDMYSLKVIIFASSMMASCYWRLPRKSQCQAFHSRELPPRRNIYFSWCYWSIQYCNLLPPRSKRP